MWKRARFWFGALVGRGRFEKDLADELAFHLQSQVDSLERQGVPAAEARQRAHFEFGSPERVKEEVRDVRLGAWCEQLGQDLRHGLRLLRRDAGLSLGIVLILAVALGLATAIWSFADKSLLRPLPFEDADRLVWVRGSDTRRGLPRMPVSYPDFRDWRERSRSLDDLAAWRHELRIRSDGERWERMRVGAASPNLYPLLGVTPHLGTLPRSETDVVLTYAYWNARFGADPDVIGSSLRLDDVSFTIVGVLGERFTFPPLPTEFGPEVWLSLDHSLDPAARTDRGARDLWAVGRLARGANPDEALSELNAIARDLERAYPETNRETGVSMGPLGHLWVDGLGRVLPIILAGAALALLVACSNVAGLLASRAVRRRMEFAVRSALGAGRLRLARQLAAEVGLLFVAGTGAGLALAHVSLPVLAPQFSQGGAFFSDTPQIDVRVFAVMAAVAGATALLTSLGLVADVRPGRGAVSVATGTAGAPRRSAWRSAMLVGQVAVSMVVVFAAALLTESLRNAVSEPVGFDMENLLALRIEMPAELREEPERIANALRQIGESADLVAPGDSLALAASGPFGNRGLARFFETARRPVADASRMPLADYRLVSRNYFDVLGIPALRGQPLPARSEGVLPVVVNQAFADRHFGDQDPVGAGLNVFSGLEQGLDRSQLTAAEIVGVVGDEKIWRLDGQRSPQIYADMASQPPSGFDLMVRTSDPEGARERVMAGLAPMLPGASIDRVRRIEASARATVRGRWVAAVVMDLFSSLALVLMMIGVYGVLSSAVQERRRELAVRTSLGASPGALVGLVVRDGLLIASAGVALGVAGSLVAGRVLASHVYTVSPTDPVTMAAAGALLILLASVAAWFPARRAGRIAPAAVLREV